MLLLYYIIIFSFFWKYVFKTILLISILMKAWFQNKNSSSWCLKNFNSYYVVNVFIIRNSKLLALPSTWKECWVSSLSLTIEELFWIILRIVRNGKESLGVVKQFAIIRMDILGMKRYRDEVQSFTKKVLHQKVKICLSDKLDFSGVVNLLN